MGGRAKRGQENMRQLMRSALEARERNQFADGGRYPSCFGKYPDCPAEAKAFFENKGKEGYGKENAPHDCVICPYFKW